MMQFTRYGVSTSSFRKFGLWAAAIVVAMLLATGPARSSTTFTVNSNGDNPDNTPGDGLCWTGSVNECTLRAAILEANSTPGADVITFAIPTTGVVTISPDTELPQLVDAVTIDGYSQPGAQPNTRSVGSNATLRVLLDGVGVSGSGSRGLRMGGANSTVKGLVIDRWGYGVSISGSDATGNRVAGNFIGTDPSGTQVVGNRASGVYIADARNNTVGGPTAADRNVISGNGESGVDIRGSGASRNEVTGNYLGTDRGGTVPLGNSDGVRLYDAPGNKVGGATTSARNMISANKNNGVSILGSGATGNEITGNYLGTDASGTTDLGNGGSGVAIEDGANNTVGGTMAGERNVISGNDHRGVLIDGPDATGNRVTGNLVGTDKDGGAVLGNSRDGVFLASPGNTIGGATASGRNVIAANQGSGISIYGAIATANRVLQNSIFANDGLGIDLGDDGVTANDRADADTGANNLQNRPTVTSAKTGGDTTTLAAKLNSTPSRTFVVRFFSNTSGTDEAKTFIGQKAVTTDASGNASFIFSPKNKVGLKRTVTATATDAGGDTSELSAARTVVAR